MSLKLDLNSLMNELSPLLRDLRSPTGAAPASQAANLTTGETDQASLAERARERELKLILDGIQKRLLENTNLPFTTIPFCGEPSIDLSQTKYKPRDYQLEAIAFLQQRKRAFLTDKPGLGKGGTKDTKILTPNGWTTLGEVSIGDSILGQDGQSHKITGVFNRGILPVFRVTFQDNTSVLCDDDHLWSVQDHNARTLEKGFTTKPLREIRQKLTTAAGRRLHFIPLMRPAQFAKVHLPAAIDPYLLGVLLGDGSIAHTAVQLTAANKFIVDCVADVLPVDVTLQIIPSATKTPTYSITGISGKVGSNSVLNALRALDLQGCKSVEKFIPKDYLFSSVDERTSLLQGLIDTDGEVRTNDGHIEFATVSEQLAKDVEFLVQSLGGVARTSTKVPYFTYNEEKRQGQLCYRVGISLPEDIYPTRVKAWRPKSKYPPYRVIKSVEYEKDAEVICISVDAKDSLYVTDYCIVTHNTLCAAVAAKLPVIIFCPTYLTYHWYNFLKEVAAPAPNNHSIAMCAGTRAQRMKVLGDKGADWTISNIEMLRDEDYRDVFQARDLNTLIIDEAHHIRGHDSQQSLGAMRLSLRAEHVFLLTATPIFNKPDDLYAQLRLIDHDAFHSYWSFVNTYTKFVDMPFGRKILGARPNLRPTFEKYNLGRTYQDVAMQLPDLISDTILIDPPDNFKALYRTLRDSYFIPGKEVYENALEVLQALRKVTGPQKLKPLLSMLTDTDALTGTVIFSYYKETARQVAELLDIPCITGDIAPKERLAIAKSATCISATIDSMSEGVDLSHLHTVVFFELDYVPGKLFQALSRVRRHGGADVVKVYYLVVKNTIDEILSKIDEHRTVTINSIVRECLEF